MQTLTENEYEELENRIIKPGVTMKDLMSKSEEELHELSAKCYELLGIIQRLYYIRHKQARSGMGAYKDDRV